MSYTDILIDYNMENFTIFNPTQIHFGKNAIDELPDKIKEYTDHILLMYGKGSVIRNGYHRIITDKLKGAGIKITEFSGIKPNPLVSDVEKAISAGINNNVGLVLALGGGSVIDSAKITALCIPEKLNAWDVVIAKVNPKQALPIFTVLTLAATGTEMNQFAVVQNEETKEKLGFRSHLMYPVHSFINPEFTYSVPADYTAYGIVDLIAHCFENYFGIGESSLSENFVASVVKESMYYAPLLLKDLNNYNYRANILLQSTFALNGTTMVGKSSGDWGVHAIGHTLSVLFDTPHGASLSVAYPAWLKLMKDKIPDKISNLSRLIYGSEEVDLFIEKIELFFKTIGSPVNLIEAGIELSEKEKIIDLMKKNKISGYKYQFSEYEKITDLMYGIL